MRQRRLDVTLFRLVDNLQLSLVFQDIYRFCKFDYGGLFRARIRLFLIVSMGNRNRLLVARVIPLLVGQQILFVGILLHLGVGFAGRIC